MTSTVRYYSFKDIPWTRCASRPSPLLYCPLVAIVWRVFGSGGWRTSGTVCSCGFDFPHRAVFAAASCDQDGLIHARGPKFPENCDCRRVVAAGRRVEDVDGREPLCGLGRWRLVDEENVAGTLTENGMEAAVIQRVEEDTFRGARYAFLAGSTGFGKILTWGRRERLGQQLLILRMRLFQTPMRRRGFRKLKHSQERASRRMRKRSACFLCCGRHGGSEPGAGEARVQKLDCKRMVAAMFPAVLRNR